MIKLQQATLLDKRLACAGLLLLHRVQVLDVGRCSSLWRLPSSLLRLSQLERLVVPSKAIAQVRAVVLLPFANCTAPNVARGAHSVVCVHCLAWFPN